MKKILLLATLAGCLTTAGCQNSTFLDKQRMAEATLRQSVLPEPSEVKTVDEKRAMVNQFKEFLTSHQDNEEVAATLRSNQARLLLTDYGLLESPDFEEEVAYLTAQLAAAPAPEEAMLIKAITYLKDSPRYATYQALILENLEKSVQTNTLKLKLLEAKFFEQGKPFANLGEEKTRQIYADSRKDYSQRLEVLAYLKAHI